MHIQTAQQYQEQLETLAREAFESHQIIKTEGPLPDPSRWLIMRIDGSSFYWSEIVHLQHGRLFVHGDIEEVLWRGGPPDWRKAIDWVATADWSYAWEKCGKPTVEKKEVARSELVELRCNGYWKETREAAIMGLAMLNCGDDLERVKQRVFDEIGDAELVSGLGRVPDPKFFYAWEAVKTLKRLLDALPKLPMAVVS